MSNLVSIIPNKSFIDRTTEDLRRKLYIPSLLPGDLNKALNHDWFVARADGGIVFKDGEVKFSYPFGGTLEQAIEWINSRPEKIKHYFSWVPREFVIEHLMGIKSYPS